MSSWKDPVEVSPRWKPEPSAGGMGQVKRERETCRRGHSLATAYRRSDGRLQCRECRRETRPPTKPQVVKCPVCGELRNVTGPVTPRCRRCARIQSSGSGAMRLCEGCGKDFYARKRATGKLALFCSLECRRKSGHYRSVLGAKLSAERRGAGNPAFKHGDRIGVNPYGWKIANKGGARICRNCGAGGGIHLHHAIPRSKAPRLKEDLRNGVPLCAACHMGWHAKKVTLYRDIFTDDEWAFLSSVSLTGENVEAWLDDHYPMRETP